jgi:hypothetical protein
MATCGLWSVLAGVHMKYIEFNVLEWFVKGKVISFFFKRLPDEFRSEYRGSLNGIMSYVKEREERRTPWNTVIHFLV